MKIKDRIEIEVTLKTIYEYTKSFGYTATDYRIYIMEDENGQQYKWNTSSLMCLDLYNEEGDWTPKFAHKGDKIKIKGTVKEFSEYKGTTQVVLTRCSLVDVITEAPTKEQFREQKRQKQLESLQEEDFVWEMPYRQYKSHYSDCETLSGSYQIVAGVPVIKVIIRAGRLKASGVRGRHYSGYRLQNSNGKQVTYRAVCEENAIRRAEKEYPNETWECIEIYTY